MKIWVDADACPVAVKDILFRAAERTKTKLSLVANKPIRIPKSSLINFILVPAGFDVADNEIVKMLKAADLVITADIPLAAAVIEKGGQALNPRGELYSQENIKSILSVRNFMDSLRSTGVETGGPRSLNKTDHKSFADQLDKILRHYKNQ